MTPWRETRFYPNDLCYGEMWRLNFEEGWRFAPLLNHHGHYSILAWRPCARGDVDFVMYDERCYDGIED